MVIFTFSKKIFGSKKVRICLVVLIVVVLATAIFFIFRDDPDTAEFDGKTYSIRADTTQEIMELADFFGLKINSEPIYVKNVVIPAEFNDIYSHYNDLQKLVGLDLEKYKGRQCRLYSYRIIEPKEENSSILNLLILDGRVIGGDISEEIFDGEIYALSGKNTDKSE